MSKRPRPAARPAGSRSARPARRKKPQPKSKAQRFLLRYGWLLPVGAILVGAGILVLTYAFASIPLPQDIRLTSSAEVFDVNGKLIGTYSDEIKRFLIDTDKLLAKKPFVGEAVIAAEDRQFYEHNGVSLRGIARAAWANLTGGEVQQGGSTITQQYVKNAVLQDPSRTVTRKAKEAILAIKLERRYSKKQILGFYLNTIYLGRGAYGIEAAARAYFDTHAEDLSLKQMAYLAGIIPAPERYQADENPVGARERRDRTLTLMAEEGFISDERAERALGLHDVGRPQQRLVVDEGRRGSPFSSGFHGAQQCAGRAAARARRPPADAELRPGARLPRVPGALPLRARQQQSPRPPMASAAFA